MIFGRVNQRFNPTFNIRKWKHHVMFKKDSFGYYIFLKKLVTRFVGLISYPGFNWFNKTEIQGSAVFKELPASKVLIVSNHQTYFADAAAITHIIHASVMGKFNTLRFPGFLLRPKTSVFAIAADETMKKGLIPNIMRYAGAITVKRTWRAKGENVKRELDRKDPDSIGKALDEGWVISFPQGTTTPFAPGRKGTAHIIKEYQPIVIPVVIDGFRRAFDKKGLIFKKKRSILKVDVKEPIDIDYSAPVDVIMKQIMDAIGQSSQFDKVAKMIPGK
ncbi:MAG: 1-acyl-sn-glycerol-3-phosphate acyltransferase [Patiriisocius sp.]